MIRALNSDLGLLDADIAQKKDENGIKIDYKCKSCDAEMILKKGEVKIHHFAHKVKDNCVFGKKESKEHYEMKYHLRDLFGRNIEMEKIIFDGDTRHIADVVYDNVVFEVQFSPMPFDEFKKRTLGFSKNGYKVVWIFHSKNYGEIGRKKYRYWKIRKLLFYMYCWEIPIFIYDGDKKKIFEWDKIVFVDGKSRRSWKFRHYVKSFILGINKTEVRSWKKREIFSSEELIAMAVMGSSTDENGDEISIKRKFRKNDIIHRGLGPRIDEKNATINHYFYICEDHNYPMVDSASCAKYEYFDYKDL